MKYLILLISSLISSLASSQTHILEKKGGKYYYMDKTYNSKQLGEVYIEYNKSMDLYLSGESNKRAANIIAIIGAPFVVGGIIGVTSGDYGGVVLGALSLVAGGIIEIVALIPRGVGSSKLQKARRIFNYEMIERHGYNAETALSISATENGVGFVFQF